MEQDRLNSPGTAGKAHLMVVQAYLEQGPQIQKRIEALEYTRKMLYMRAISPPSAAQQMGSKVQHSAPTEASFCDSVAEADEMAKTINKKQDLLNSLHVQIIGVIIRSVTDEEARMLIAHFIEGKQWQEVAGEMHCSLRTLYRMKDAAVKKIVLPENPIWAKE